MDYVRRGRWLLSIFLWFTFIWSSISAKREITPISVPVGTDWFGYDGNWSPVNIRVGSPPQWVSVFPSTASQETWVVGRYGCDGTFTCRQLRGGLFEANTSSTWQNIGYFQLDLDANLGFSGYGDYGWDNIALDEVTVSPHQAIAVVNSTEYWLGYLGLGIRHINFTNDNDLTYLSTLVENQSLIPSHSYGYTAGAYYRLKKVPSSLTLGGVDANRFEPNGVSFDLSPDQMPVVALNSITVKADPLSTSTTSPSWKANPLTLLGAGTAKLFTIDSTTPFLWLPADICEAFAEAFGLAYNETLQLYTFEGNTTAHDNLVNWNMTFTFTVADLPGSTKTVDILLPYSAFDLQLSYPYPQLWANSSSPDVNYFPLRRAANDSEYTIGRVFLQEAYLAVDYERSNFSVSQAKFAIDALTNKDIVTITRPANSTLAGPVGSSVGGSSGLAKGAIAGIAIAGLLIVALAVFMLFYLKRRKARKGSSDGLLSDKPEKGQKKRGKGIFYKLIGAPSDVPPIEMPGDKRQPTEVPADAQHSRFELPGNAPVELAGSDPSSYYSGTTEGGSNMYSHGQYLSAYAATARKLDSSPSSAPAELGHSDSTRKSPNGEFFAPPSKEPRLPAYSPDTVGQPDAPSPQSGTVSPPSASPRGTGSFGAGVISSTSSTTSPKLSPMTPVTPQRADRPVPPYSTGMPSPYDPSINAGTGNESRSSLQVQQAAPVRSTSRGSRFVEEGISTGSSAGSNEALVTHAKEVHDQQRFRELEAQRRAREAEKQAAQQQQQLQPPPSTERTRRFSWEEGSTM